MSGPDASSWTIAPQRSLLPAEAKSGVLALLSDHPDSDNAAPRRYRCPLGARLDGPQANAIASASPPSSRPRNDAGLRTE
jgi:hypothetical protein